MKKSIGVMVAAIIVLVVASQWLSSYYGKSSESNEIARLAKTAFITLDSKVAKGFAATFVYEIPDTSRQVAPLFENLGNHHFPITTKSEIAQKYFNQGLSLAYAFNHAESHRSFLEVSRLEPGNAMAWWGQAYALSPNINDPFPDAERRSNGYKAIQKALKLTDNVTAKEKDLIDALSTRFSANAEADLAELNSLYMAAMAEVADKYPDDADIQTMYGAAVMNTMPWNYWDKEGNPNPNTLEGKEALEKAMAINPDHPGAHHYYIHMVELPKPELAVPSAEKLGSLMPAAGHIVHMPSHIFIRVGRYEDAVKANLAAIAADEDYISQCYSQGLYPLAYFPHNIHFLWSAASLLGNSETALAAARKTAEKVPISMFDSLPFLQDYFTTPMLSYVRFGKWNEILTIPDPGPSKHVKLIWHYARGIAFVRKGNVKEAEEELDAIARLTEDPELESLIANYTNPSSGIAKVAHRVVAGELEALKGNYDQAIYFLKEGVTFEDALTYSEPAPWHIPVRQTLGAILIKADKAAEAELVYREDLEINKNNGWSLAGLHASLIAQRKEAEAKVVQQQLMQAWAKADITINSSVL